MNPTYQTYGEWLIILEALTLQKLALELADLPDACTLDAYQSGLSPEQAFKNFCADHWQDYDPDNFLLGMAE